jgi:hypothetical protein
MKIKVFEEYSATLLEEMINHWINDNPDIIIDDIRMDNSSEKILSYIIYRSK